MLHPLDLTNMKTTAWCVPSAISMLTGCPVEKAHSRAAFLQNKSFEEVSGVYVDESILMLHELGYKVKKINIYDRYVDKVKRGPSIKRFLSELKPEEFMSSLLVFTHSHAFVSHMGWVGDNWTRRPVPLDKFPKPKRLVEQAFIVI